MVNIKSQIKVQPISLLHTRSTSPSKGIIDLVRTQNSQKTKIFYPLLDTRMSAYEGVRNVSFSESFAYVLNG